MVMSSWKELLCEALAEEGESWEDVEGNTMSDAQMSEQFDYGYGAPEGTPFTVWTKRSVYFPLCYDGAEWVGRVARHPDGEPTCHLGGW